MEPSGAVTTAQEVPLDARTVDHLGGVPLNDCITSGHMMHSQDERLHRDAGQSTKWLEDDEAEHDWRKTRQKLTHYSIRTNLASSDNPPPPGVN
jgi:hypothetical protein